MSGNAETIYKIFRSAEWAAFRDAGRFLGSPDDLRDGFIHFSTAGQLRGTAAKYFSGESEIILAAVDAAGLGEALRWEASRGGMLFPHLYAPLEMSAVAHIMRVERDASGDYRFTDAIP